MDEQQHTVAGLAGIDAFDSGDGAQQWTVVAVMVDGGGVEPLPAGEVVAADLSLAADQICGYLPPRLESGQSCYLVATPGMFERDSETGLLNTAPGPTWVNRIRRTECGWERSEWGRAPHWLGRPDAVGG
ncbi:hypothetical protein [Nocardia pseudobrasiliensis]|uniref:Uncharacterized protein n=1 Tax=Nocardia pseudobrasiliensis TaxID=45979 RepID=A0A370I8H5_9NOCA|nr:hypothetical protein [Nocardia pseudobrasiliensis]RDI66910.1 hypothetical protein DFR76_104663 [Nocardia pseudobrasiliensis]